jgi:hypothetical protein
MTTKTQFKADRFLAEVLSLVCLAAGLLGGASVSSADVLEPCQGGCLDAQGYIVSKNVVAEESDCEAKDPDSKQCDGHGQAACEASVSYPVIQLPAGTNIGAIAPTLAAVNADLKSEATSYTCGPENAIVKFKTERIYAHGPLLSVVAFALNYPQGAAGGCHGDYLVETFDLTQSSHRLNFKDVIQMKRYADLKKMLLLQLKADHAQEFDNFDSSDQAKEWDHVLKQASLLLDDAPNGSFFIEKGAVWINLPSFLFSCASGNFNPVRVPDNFLNRYFLKTLAALRP